MSLGRRSVPVCALVSRFSMVFRRFPSRWFQTALFLLCFACLESRAVRLDDEPMASLSSRRAIEGGDRVGRNTDPALSFSSHRFRTLHRGRFDPGGGAARTERTVFEIQDKAKEPGPYGVPLGTWVGIGFAILVLVVLCIVARIYIKQVRIFIRISFSFVLCAHSQMHIDPRRPRCSRTCRPYTTLRNAVSTLFGCCFCRSRYICMRSAR